MIARIPIRILACALGLATLGLGRRAVVREVQPGPAVGPGRPQGTSGSRRARRGSPASPVPDVGSASEREERRTQAREDVASLDAYVKAKQAQLREAEFRLQVTRSNLGRPRSAAEKGRDLDAYSRMMGELSVVEAEADRETRSAELKAVEIRRDRAMRRMALIDRGGVPDPAGLSDLPSSGERLTILERETDRLRYEMDRTDKRIAGEQLGVP